MVSARDQLIKDYPLHVLFPHLSGRYLMMQWKAHDAGNNINLGRSDAGLCAMFEIALDAFPDAEPEKVWEIEVVAPPRAVMLRSAQCLKEDEISLFQGYVGQHARTLHDAGVELPPGIQLCRAINHWDCGGCWGGIRFELDDFYPRLLTNYRASVDGRREGAPSSAAVWGPKEKIYRVVGSFGPHNPGLEVQEVGPHDCRFVGTFFFFRRIAECAVPAGIEAAVLAEASKVAAEGAAEAKVLEARRAKLSALEVERAREFFGL